jgi:hypothetical protein
VDTSFSDAIVSSKSTTHPVKLPKSLTCCPDRNGGRCLQQDDLALCDCTKAVNKGLSTRYVGPTCSTRVTYPSSYCDNTGGSAFCVNGGSCRTVQSSDYTSRPCHCPTGFSGVHCEFPSGTTGVTDRVVTPIDPPKDGLTTATISVGTIFLTGMLVFVWYRWIRPRLCHFGKESPTAGVIERSCTELVVGASVTTRHLD